MRFHLAAAAMITLTCGAFAWGAPPRGGGSSAGAGGWVAAALQHAHPGVRLSERGAGVARVFGGPFGGGSSPEDAAERFRQNYAGLFGTSAAEWDPRSLLADERHTQPLMFDPSTGTYKFVLVYYTQRKEGIPVFGADLRLLVRNQPGYPLVLACSTLRDLGGFTAMQVAAPSKSNVGHAQARAVAPGVGEFSAPRQVIWAGLDDKSAPPRMAVTFTGVESDAPQKWRFVADSGSGRLLYYEPLLLDLEIAGHVAGMASEGPAAPQCEPEVEMPMAHARVSSGETVVFTNDAGDFVLPHVGAGSATVRSAVGGEWFRVFDYSGNPTILARSVVPPGPANFLHNAADSELPLAQVNAYRSANAQRSHVLQFNPDYPTLAHTNFPVNVNRSDFLCPGNAWYDPAGQSINFCRSAFGLPNTAWSSVVFHEYGHHLVAASGSGQGAYGEGMGDVMSVLLLDHPDYALGFLGPCGVPLRTADNSLQYPCVGPIHFCGQVLSGCVWDTRNELAEVDPTGYRDTLSSLAINAMLLHGGSLIAPDITLDYLALDDDDANLNNGTPHAAEICAGFGAHNMDCPEFDDIGFRYPGGLPQTVPPGAPYQVRVDVFAAGGATAPGSAWVHYRTRPGEFTTAGMIELAENSYEAELPASSCGDWIEYYFSAAAQAGGLFTDPADAPILVFTAISATEVFTLASYDFETDPGWSVSNSADLIDGAWELGVPAGGGDRGDPPADFDGSGQCWLTDNAAGNSDVDQGTTWLTSDLLDLSEGGSVAYAYWLNDIAVSPLNGDSLTVEVAGDRNSDDWQVLRTYAAAAPFWRTDRIEVGTEVPATATFRMRFAVTDGGLQGVVEAGVDAFKVVRAECASCSEPCDDGNACTVVDHCEGPDCRGTAVDCSLFDDDCNQASCDPGGAEGNCDVMTPVPDGASCAGGGGVCSGGECKPASAAPPVSCTKAQGSAGPGSGGVRGDNCVPADQPVRR